MEFIPEVFGLQNAFNVSQLVTVARVLDPPALLDGLLLGLHDLRGLGLVVARRGGPLAAAVVAVLLAVAHVVHVDVRVVVDLGGGREAMVTRGCGGG